MHEESLEIPLGWAGSRVVFAHPDLFHVRVSDEFIVEVFEVMASTPKHTYAGRRRSSAESNPGG